MKYEIKPIHAEEQSKYIGFLQEKLFNYSCEIERLKYFLEDLISAHECGTETEEKAAKLLDRIDILDTRQVMNHPNQSSIPHEEIDTIVVAWADGKMVHLQGFPAAKIRLANTMYEYWKAEGLSTQILSMEAFIKSISNQE